MWGRTDALQVRRKQPTAQINAGTLTNGAVLPIEWGFIAEVSTRVDPVCGGLFADSEGVGANTASP